MTQNLLGCCARNPAIPILPEVCVAVAEAKLYRLERHLGVIVLPVQPAMASGLSVWRVPSSKGTTEEIVDLIARRPKNVVGCTMST